MFLVCVFPDCVTVFQTLLLLHIYRMIAKNYLSFNFVCVYVFISSYAIWYWWLYPQGIQKEMKYLSSLYSLPRLLNQGIKRSFLSISYTNFHFTLVRLICLLVIKNLNFTRLMTKKKNYGLIWSKLKNRNGITWKQTEHSYGLISLEFI